MRLFGRWARGQRPVELFARFVDRMACICVELLVVALATSLAINLALVWPALVWLGPGEANHGHLRALLLVAYFGVSWASPLAATPVQYLWGLRVVDAAGNPLSVGRALLRSVLLLALLLGAWSFMTVRGMPALSALALASYPALFLAALTRKRQAAHDLCVGSFVVWRRALDDSQARALLAQSTMPASVPTADVRPEGRRRLFAVLSVLGQAFVLGAVVFGMYTAVDIAHTKDMAHRISYAVEQTSDLRAAVESHYAEYAEMPANRAALGIGARVDYPDGGHFELVEDGRIRIQFTVIPALRRGAILLNPRLDGTDVRWACVGEGGFEPRYVRFCR